MNLLKNIQEKIEQQQNNKKKPDWHKPALQISITMLTIAITIMIIGIKLQ